MKMVTLIAALFLTTNLFAGNDETCSSNSIKENIIHLIETAPPFSDFDLEGIVTIQFEVDDNHHIHVKQVSSGNTLLANHVMSSLQNKLLSCDCVMPGTTYVLRLQYVQYS
ncbi:MAG: hypothetical protein V9F05_07415 [Chitinophagaceae bacterium]|mgnify:FL=1|jgi:hypothetical protein|nr:hypothetical protein [Bacteroidota bacterium]MBP9879115.1 hypothetical protein [Chitinophagales bacterium]